MAHTTEEKRQRMLDNARAAQVRAREREKEKRNDPQWRAAQKQKQLAALQRQRERQAEKQNSPEHKQQLADKRQASWQRSKKPAATTRKPSRGIKGRSPTADERRVMDALGSLPCIACLLHGVTTSEISLHHIAGRTAPDAHKKVLPLCVHHHQHAAPADVREAYPWLVPVHACGTVGGKADFSQRNLPEMDLLIRAYALAGIAD